MLVLPWQKLDTLDDVRVALANAIRLELSTIPPYLTALYSIRPGRNLAVAAILRHIVMQEMLHLALASNILNAVGGRPDLPGSVPKYPGPLPMHIGMEHGEPFIVPLARLSRELVSEIFMRIESPEDPLLFERAKLHPIEEKDHHTIGEFYGRLVYHITRLGESIFTGDPRRQVTGWFGADELFAVTDVATAEKAIDLIVVQGEGTPKSPTGFPHGLSHYYLFEQIARGETLAPDPHAPHGYAWTLPRIELHEMEVFPIITNAPDVRLPESRAATLADTCDRTFSALIDALQQTFDGDPSHLGSAVGLMYTLRLQAQQLMSMTVVIGINEFYNAAPRFLYRRHAASG